MGVGMYDIHQTRHWMDLTPPEVEFYDRVHYGNGQVDTTGPAFSPTRFAAHKQAAQQGQTAFDSEYATTAPVWYGTLSTASRAALRKAYL